MIKFVVKGDLTKTKTFLRRAAKVDIPALLHSCGQQGVDALRRATPVKTGLVAESWSYSVFSKGGKHSITWNNSDIENGFPVAIMIQYGHGTGTGGYVEGFDYINPAIRPIFKKIQAKVWKGVTS